MIHVVELCRILYLSAKIRPKSIVDMTSFSLFKNFRQNGTSLVGIYCLSEISLVF